MDIGRTNILQHEIPTGDAAPIAKRPYKGNFKKNQFIEKEVQDMLQRGLIRESSSPWAAPVVVVEKKGGTSRLCVDYRDLNAVTRDDKYPLPLINDMVESFRTANWFTTLDLASGYWQVEMKEDDKEKTAFITKQGLYEFNVMPFGLKNAPGTFQRLMNQVLRKYLNKFVAVYIDDIIIYSKTFEEHLDHVEQVFQALLVANLRIKLKKSKFCFPNIPFLGHIVGRDGIQPDSENIEKVKNYPVPTDLTSLRGALGLFSYYRKFIKGFSKIAKPMNELLKKDIPFKWTSKQQKAFETLRDELIKAPILQYPDFEKPFELYTDACGTGLGAVLSQKDKGGRERVIAYASRSLTKAEGNYPITEQECLAVIWAVKHFSPYLQLLPFKIYTDHSALKSLTKCKEPTGRRARWVMELQQYDFIIEHRPGKENKNADALSRMYEKEREVPIFLLEVENTKDGKVSPDFLLNFSNSQEISREIPDIFTPQTSRETSREIPLIRTNGSLEGSLSDTEYEADDELRQIEKWTNMVKNDPDDEDQWLAYSNEFITFTQVSSKEEIERWECIVKKDGYAVALNWIKDLRLTDPDEVYFTNNLLRMFLKIHVESDVVYRNLVTEVHGKVINMEFFVENKQDYESFVRMARTLRPITEEEEEEINEMLEDMETESEDEMPLTVEEVLFDSEPVEIIEPRTPEGTPPMSPQPPRPYSCCGQIICECTRNTPVSYPSDYEVEPQEV